MSEMPGPLVGVKARAPAHPAPITTPAAASSSSTWAMKKLRSPVSGSLRKRSQKRLKASISDVEGVIGYHAPTVAPANTQPSAAAVLPSMSTCLEVASIVSSRIGSGQSKCSIA